MNDSETRMGLIEERRGVKRTRIECEEQTSIQHADSFSVRSLMSDDITASQSHNLDSPSTTSNQHDSSLDHASTLQSSIDASTSSCSLSALETLPSVLFYMTCSYLTIDDKCASLLVLCKSIRSLFMNNYAACCKGWLSINLPIVDKKTHVGIDQTALKLALTDQNVSRVNYMSYAFHLSVNYPGPHVKSSKLITHIRASVESALIAGVVNSMYIQEQCGLLPHAHTANQQITALNGSLISSLLMSTMTKSDLFANVKELYLELLDGQKTYHDERLALYADGFVHCKSLVALKVVLPRQHTNVRSFEQIVRALPQQLEEFYCDSMLPDDTYLALCQTFFSSPTYLPLLRVFDMTFMRLVEPESNSAAAYAFLHDTSSLIHTLQTSSGKIRPLQSTRLNGLNLTCETLSKLDSLTDLDIFNHSDDIAAALNSQHADCLPHLRSLIIRSSKSHTNLLTPILSFASKRPIESLTLENVIPSAKLSEEFVKSVSAIHSLKHLKISRFITYSLSDDTPNLFIPDAWTVFSLIGANSWPQLESLSLYHIRVGPEAVPAILRAIPNCRRIKLVDVDFNGLVSQTLAMVLHYCPHVVDVCLRFTFYLDRFPTDTAKCVEKYPVHASGLQNLVRVSLPDWHYTGDILHMVVGMLSSAPRLALFEVDSLDQSLEMLCALRRLTHLHTLPHFNADRTAKKNPLLNLPVFKDCMKHVRTAEFECPMRKKWRINQPIDTAPQVLSDFLVRVFGSDVTHVAFRSELNEAGVNGRDEYFTSLYAIMDREQRTKLKRWDDGEHEDLVIHSPTHDDYIMWDDKPSRSSHKKSLHSTWSYYTT